MQISMPIYGNFPFHIHVQDIMVDMFGHLAFVKAHEVVYLCVRVVYIERYK